MKFCSIASGSSGNAYYVGVGEDHFLFDAGVSGKYIEHSLYDINVRKISGIFITHEHRDHAKGAGIFARKFNTNVYATPLTWRYFLENNVLGKIPEEQQKIIEPEKPIKIGEATITAFDIPHDAAQPVGYIIESKCCKKIAFATDLGHVTDTVLKHIKGANLLLIESNHDIHMLQTGAYPIHLKERVFGNFGHLSNETTGNLLVKIAHPNLQYVILAHLSKDNNTPEIAQNTITKILKANNTTIENLYIASRNKPSSIINLSSELESDSESSESQSPFDKNHATHDFKDRGQGDESPCGSVRVKPSRSNHDKFTEPQQAAISCNASAILVSAAAGSGKTAVLTERIVKHISQGVSVSDLLIVTFTEAASAEMRERVTNKLNELHKNADENSKEKAVYAKQISLLPMADISTIHSFCRRLVKEHFQVVNIDPNFRVGDMGELSLIRSQVMNDLFEKEYSREDNADFLDLANVYGGKTMDGRLDQLVRKIFDFMESAPFPLEAAQKYSDKFSNNITDLDSTPWADVVREELSQGLDGVLESLRQALELCDQLGGPEKYIPLLEMEYQQIQELQKMTKKTVAKKAATPLCGAWGSAPLGDGNCESNFLAEKAATPFLNMYDAFLRFVWGKLPRILEKDNVDPNLKERVQRIRNKAAKDKIKSLVKGVFFAPPNKMQSDLMALAPRVSALMRLATRFSLEYAIEKRARNILDFSDLEHFAIQILYPNGALGSASIDKKYYEVLTDEYQDSNKVQDMILSAIAERQFMVGDVKQSIYRFRRAEPELFNEKYNAFVQYDGDGVSNSNIDMGGVRIDLSHNFRSHPRVLNAVNFFFSQLMCEQVGEVNYDNAAALHPGFPQDEYEKYPHKDSPQMWVEILDQTKEDEDTITIEGMGDEDENGNNDNEELSNVVSETRVIAQCIHELLRTRKVWDKDLKKVRPCKLCDMAILTRGLANSSGEIIEELKKYGIEAIADTTTGFFDQIEVKTALSFLRITDNPRQDIDLITAMHSPVYGFTPDELLTIRQFPIPTTIVIEDDSKPPVYDFYDHVISISEQKNLENKKNEKNEENELSQKVNHFLSDLETWRKASVYMPISRLIGLIYDTTSYPAYVANMKGGANLRLLLERAIEFEETSLRGLFHFIHYLERLADSDVAENTPSAVEPSSTQENAVRLMTIHKSKGLEFPIIFCSFLGKQFNMDSERQPVIMHSDLGVGPYYVDTELRTRANTLARFSLSRLTRRESLSEELRCLYVALTRAQELLILTGRCNDLYKSLEKWSDPMGHSEITLPVYFRREAKTYLDWILPCLLRHRDGAETFDFAEQSIQVLWNHPAKFRIRSHKQELINNLELPVLEQHEKTETTEIEIPQPITTPILPIVLSEGAKNKLPSKLSISEIKRLYNVTPDTTIHNDTAPNFDAPAFIRGKGLTPMQLGSILHTVVEHLDYHRHTTPTTIEELIKELVVKNFLSEEESTKVNRKKINTLVNSNLAERMRKAKKIYKETPFVLSLLANTLYDLPKEQENERILVHGIIDCYFEEDGQIVLLDYKSDAWQGSPQEWANNHKVQMQIYKQALEEATKLKVKEALLYSFSKDVAVSCF